MMNNNIHKRIVAFLLLGIWLGLTGGCVRGLDRPVATPTPVVVGVISAPVPIGDLVISPDKTPESFKNEPPLQLTFTSPGSHPDFLWRAPLLEAPLAINPHDHFYFVRPIAADEVNWPLGDYRYGYYFTSFDVIHYGIDVDATQGSPVYAAGPGKVVFSGFGLQNGSNDPDDPYGMAVMIKHDYGYNGKPLYTVYGHMDRVDVINGQRVETGTPLGIVGNTGATTGPHLHFEVRVGNFYSSFQNPELWIVPPQDTGVLAGRIVDIFGVPIKGLDVKLVSTSNNRVYEARTYAGRAISEPALKENLVRGDIPAGDYTMLFSIGDDDYKYNFQIVPGTVNFFIFQPDKGLKIGMPAETMPENWINSIHP